MFKLSRRLYIPTFSSIVTILGELCQKLGSSYRLNKIGMNVKKIWSIYRYTGIKGERDNSTRQNYVNLRHFQNLSKISSSMRKIKNYLLDNITSLLSSMFVQHQFWVFDKVMACTHLSLPHRIMMWINVYRWWRNAARRCAAGWWTLRVARRWRGWWARRGRSRSPAAAVAHAAPRLGTPCAGEVTLGYQHFIVQGVIRKCKQCRKGAGLNLNWKFGLFLFFSST